MPGPLTDQEILQERDNRPPLPWKVIHEPKPEPKPHKCEMPGRQYGARLGTIIECRECGQRWEYSATFRIGSPHWHQCR